MGVPFHALLAVSGMAALMSIYEPFADNHFPTARRVSGSVAVHPVRPLVLSKLALQPNTRNKGGRNTDEISCDDWSRRPGWVPAIRYDGSV
jgi:hypothetical protein